MTSVDVKKQEKLKEFVSNHVLVCQSGLVAELLERGTLDFEDIVNLQMADEELKDMGYKTKKAREEARDNGEDTKDIYEWWVVDGWLLDKLEAEGEPILRTDFGDWWGRTTTGQAIALDWVIEKIYDGIKH